MFYQVLALDGEDTPDVLRKYVHEALDLLSYMVRDDPALPADPCHPACALPGALANDVAMLLPPKHCAFKGRAWRGRDTMSSAKHTVQVHDADSKQAMECFEALRPCVFEDQNKLALSVCNEGIAIAVRRGAPLASYSIDRKCLHAYMQHLTNVDAKTLVCCVCARRFLHVSGGKNNAIALRSLLTCEVDAITVETSVCFLGMKQENATKLFGLKKYCDTYGRMSEGVHLAESHE